jgi:hypothetical protein
MRLSSRGFARDQPDIGVRPVVVAQFWRRADRVHANHWSHGGGRRRMATIFLSHSSRNDALASRLETWLRANGFDDLFVDHDSIRSGDKWSAELRRAKASCRVVMCLVTPEWLSSDECYAEFRAAWYMGRRIVALLCVGHADLDDKQKSHLDHLLAEDQGNDITRAGAPDALDLDAHPEVVEPLTAGLRAAGALAKIGLDPRAFEIDRDRRPEPFPGLESFGDDDADAAIFFGREPEIAQCLEDLREMRANGDRRAYAIVGASGSGKSSLMKAGVLPRLRRERGLFVLASFRPGADPLLNLAEAIARTAADRGESLTAGAIRDRLRDAWRDKADLRGVLDQIVAPLKRRADKPSATVLIALDQAEELARAQGEGANIVGALLKAAALAEAGPGESQPYAVMITVRSDSFAEVQASDRFEGLTTRSADIRTLPIYRFASAIEEPAARYGVEIEPALIEALIEDAGGKDALPLLAFTLQRLWRQYQAEKRIVKANYDSIGKVSGLVEDAAERALRGLDPLAPQGPLAGRVSAEQDRRAARLFVPTLAQVNESGAAIRRVAKLEAFDAGERELLDQFDRWRLVVRDGELTEVAHEAMFREWPRFRQWLEPEKARLEALRGVQIAAAAWNAHGRRADDLTHRGRRLAEARALDRSRDYKTQLDNDAKARTYLAAAGAAERRRGLRAGAAAAVFMAVVGVLAFAAYQGAERAKTQQIDRSLLANERDAERAEAAADLDLAVAKFAANVAIAEQLVGREPTNPQWTYNLARAHASLGYALAKRGRSGDQARARAEYLEAKEAVANLAAMDAGDPGLRANRMQLAGWLAQQLAS